MGRAALPPLGHGTSVVVEKELFSFMSNGNTY